MDFFLTPSLHLVRVQLVTWLRYNGLFGIFNDENKKCQNEINFSTAKAKKKLEQADSSYGGFIVFNARINSTRHPHFFRGLSPNWKESPKSEVEQFMQFPFQQCNCTAYPSTNIVSVIVQLGNSTKKQNWSIYLAFLFYFV